MTYLIFKAIHFIAFVAWFAGVFYLFRLFVYHTENKDQPTVVALFIIMERRLYQAITVPAMIVTFVCGAAMIYMRPIFLHQAWLHTKLTLVILLAAFTWFNGYTYRRYAKGDIFLTSKQCRFLNEVPTLFLIAIMVLMVVLRYT